MNKKCISAIILSIFTAIILFPTLAWGADFTTETKSAGNLFFTGLGFNLQSGASVSSVIGRYIAIALSFAGAIFLVIAVYAGFLWMTAGGNKEQIEKAKKMLGRAVIGLVIVMSAYAITWVVIQLVGPSTITGEEKVYF